MTRLVRLAWWVPPVVVLLALWAALAGRLEQTYYGDATGAAGEILDGHSVGQTFIAQHDGLSGVDLQLATYARPNSGTVVLHLRRDVTHTLDLATVPVPAQDIANNDWHHFRFPPIADSRGQGYYVELEHPGAVPGNAITAYWALGRGDPYPYGRATQDRAPLDGDLTFGLHYDPPPGALEADLLRTIAGQVPGRLLLLGGLALLACPALLGLLVWGAGHGLFAGRPRRLVLLGGLLGAFALAHGLVWMVAVPPWQGPDEFSHYAYSALLAAGFSADDPSAAAQAARARIETGVLAALDARGFTRTVSWYPVPGGPARDFVTQAIYGGSTMFSEGRQPPLYYRLAAVPLRLYAADPTAAAPDIGLYLVRAGSVVWSAGVVLLAYGCALLLARGPGFRLLWLALPLTVALLPMRAFIDSMANNDVLAEFAVSLLVLVVVAWLTRRRPLDRWGALAAGVGVVLIGFNLAVKASTTVAAASMLLLGGLAGALGLQLRRLAGPRGRLLWIGAAGAGLLLAALLLLVVPAGFDRTGTAQGWFLDAGQHAPRAAVPDAHSGTYVLNLAPQHPVYQRLDFAGGHPALALTFRVWARPAPGAAPGHLTITLSSDYTPVTATAGVLTWTAPPIAAWQPVTATAIFPPGAPFVRCLVQADGPVQVDDAALEIRGLPAGTTAPALQNPSLEEPGVQLRPDSPLGRLVGLLPRQLQADLILDTLANRQPFDQGAVVQAYLADEYRSYWGWFGWLGLPLQLPDWQYLIWGGLGLAALGGWLSSGLVRPRPAAPIWALGAVVVLAASVSAAATVARQLMLLAGSGLRDFPQGRYLFVLTVPVTWLLLAGLARWPALLDRRRPATADLPLAPARRWAAWLGLHLLLYLDLYALLVVLAPYYYGRF